MAIEWANLPLVLAGPIVRRVEPERVCVWLALHESADVALEVFEAGAAGLRGSGGPIPTIALAPRLHVALVEAHPVPGSGPFEWGRIYSYDLRVRSDAGEQRLRDPGVLGASGDDGAWRRFVLDGFERPSFCLPARAADALRFVHGSCRKPHGDGVDALRMVAERLNAVAAAPSSRPAALFLTGDQIYADDVHHALRDKLIEMADAFGGGVDPERASLRLAFGDVFEAGHRRGQFLRNEAGITSTEAKGHLLTVREFYAMYLAVWSDVFWPDEAATHDDLRPFRRRLSEVRRVFANIATYSVLDDHEVTDDWYLTRAWVERVTGRDLGRRIIRNGLVAYALFQGWGSNPRAFSAGTPGGDLLVAVSSWDPNDAGRTADVERAIFVPRGDANLGPVPSSAVKWHWSLEWPEVSVIGLDTRTRRAFEGKVSPPALMDDEALDEVLGTMDGLADGAMKRVTLVVSAAPVLGVRFLEAAQRLAATLLSARTVDAEAWSFNAHAFAGLLTRLFLRKRSVVLSGDVHFAYAALARPTGRAEPTIVNLTSSGFQNESFGTIGSLLFDLAASRRKTHGAKGLPSPSTLVSKFVHDMDDGIDEQLVEGAIDGGTTTSATPEARAWEGIVGYANVGEVFFEGTDLVQVLHWRERDGTHRTTQHRVGGFLS